VTLKKWQHFRQYLSRMQLSFLDFEPLLQVEILTLKLTRKLTILDII